MINYIIQVVLFQVLFLAVYDFFLSKETFFTKNRWYLISTPVLSLILPFIKIPTFKKAVPEEVIIYLPEIFLSPEKVIQKTAMYQSIHEVNYINILFWIGLSLFTTLFLVKLFKIFNLIRQSEIDKKEGFTLVHIPNQTKAFSFFNFVFLGKEIPVSQQAKIIEHELVHSKQKHSLDLLFFELLKILMWFNPMVFIYQKRITLVHEYISDEVATKSETKEHYINHLLSNFFQVENIAFVNQFYKQTFIKKRIIMMTKTQSKKTKQLKYLVLIPVLASMLFYVACTQSDTIIEEGARLDYQGKIKIQDEFYLIKQNESGETIGIDSNGKEVDVLSLLPESVVGLNFEDGKLVTEFSYSKKTLKEKEQKMIIEALKKRAAKNKNEMTSEMDVSFMIIEDVPVFPGCEGSREELKACFSKNVQMHFARNFDADLPKTLGLSSGRKKVYIGFKIDKEGNVTDINARAPHPSIKEEVIRVMNSLPKMTPGKQRGENIGVKYSIPFTIVVE